ncbi:MAG: YbbR-like domain-containing protein [Gemmatimonadetes bacterium]|nr:YbbR-like domain-containing protein [Gemmatimonadota bacterium]
MRWKNWTDNAPAKILSFLVALLLWFSVTNEIEFENDYQFPVEYVNRPAGLTSLQPLPDHVIATVRGKGKFLWLRLRDGVCSVDLSGYQIGQNRILFSGQDIVLPKDVPVSRIDVKEPRRVTVDFDTTVVRDIPITPQVIGDLAANYTQVGKTFLSPPMARVKGPRKLVDQMALLPTVEIDVRGQKNSVRRKVRLEPPASPTVEVTPMTVDIGITIEPLIKRSLDGLTLEIASAAAPPATKITFEPPVLAVEIEAAKSVVEAAVREVTSVVVSAENWTVGTSVLEYRELRDGRLVFAARDSFPFQDLPPAAATNGAPRPTPDAPPEPEPVAVHGEVLARLALPREVKVLGITPDHVRVRVRELAEEVVRTAE